MLAVIMITHNPNLIAFSDSMRSILRNVDLVCVFDNASLNINKVRTILNNHLNVILIESDENLGISGLNVAANRAFEEGAKLISICDQDSVFPENFRKEVYSFFGKHNNAICAPLHRDKNKSNKLCQRFLFTPFGIKKLDINFDENVNDFVLSDFVIGSGMTISKDIWERVSGFDGKYFLDCADIDFCLRLKFEEIPIYLLKSCIMNHEIGIDREKVLGVFYVSMHSPIRHYYYFSGVLMLMKKKYVPISFKVSYALKLSIQYIVYCFLIKDSASHKKEINRAILNAFKAH